VNFNSYFERPVRICILICSLLGVTASACAQVSIYFDHNSTIAVSGATKHINAHLINLGPNEVKVHPTITVNTLRVISNTKDSITIPAHDTVLLPINLFIPRKAKADSSYTIRVEATLPNVIYSHFWEEATVKIEPTREIFSSLMESEAYIHSPSQLIEIKVKCSNVGNSGETVHFEVHNQYNADKGISAPTKYFIPAFTDTILTVRYFLPDKLFIQNNIQLHILGEFASNDSVFSSNLLNVFNVNSQKNFYNEETTKGVNSTNMVGMYVRDVTTENKYYEVLTDISKQTNAGDIHYHFDGMVYPKSNGQNPFNIMNSYVNFNGTNGLSVKAGDVNRSLEIPLSGRGIDVRYSGDNKKQYELGYVNSNDNLAGDFKLGNFTPSNSVFATFSNRFSETAQLKSQVIQFFDPFNHANSTLFGGSMDWNINKKQYFSLGLYNSFTTTAHYDSIRQTASGVALVLSANTFYKKWQFLSNNYLSTPSYVGLQKGAVNLEERINYNVNNKFNVWVRYNKFSNNPNYLSPYASFLNLSHYLETAEAGLERRIGRTMLSIKPYYYSETNTYNAAGVIFPQSITSKRVSFLINYNTLNHQMFSFNIDGGASVSNNASYSQFNSWKINASYQFQRFALNTYLQSGPFYPSELNVFAATGRKYELYSFGPSYNGTVFQRRLLLSVSEFITYDNSYQKWSNNVNVHGSYKLPHSMSLEINYSQMKNALFQNNGMTNYRLDIGLVKKLNQQRTKKGEKGSLELLVYLDLNGNDHYDVGEPLAINTIVKINNDLFTTDMLGKVYYNEIPGGDYNISILQSAGYVGENTAIFVNGKTYLQIPLHKMAVLKGSILLQKQEFSYETDENINNIRIIATDSKGKNYAAITDDRGEFVLYLPVNEYTIHVNPSSLPAQYELIDAVKTVKVNNGFNTPVVFKVLVKKRQIIIKKFGANGQAN